MKRFRFVPAAIAAVAALVFTSVASANVSAICVKPGTVEATLSFKNDRVTTANIVATTENGIVANRQTVQVRGTQKFNLAVMDGVITVKVSVGNSPDSPWTSAPVECRHPTPPPAVEKPKEDTPTTETPVTPPKPATPTCADLKAKNAGAKWYKKYGYPVGCVSKPKPPKKRLTCEDIPAGAGKTWYNGKLGFKCPLPPRLRPPAPINPPVTA